MIHTCEFYAIIDIQTIRAIENKFKKPISLINETINIIKFRGVKFYFFNTFGVWKMKFIIDFTILLNKGDIVESDFYEAKNKMNIIIYEIFDNNLFYDDLILTRIDFRKDIVISNEYDREVLINLYKKTKTNSLRKTKNMQYDSTIYFQNKSICICLYDKTIERIARHSSIKSYEKDVIRLEVRLFSKHLNYKNKKSTTNRINKDLENYFKNEIYLEYINKHSIPIFSGGNHYKLKDIELILIANKIKNTQEILTMLAQLSKYHYDYIYNNYSSYKIKKYFNILNELNINPIIIPRIKKVNFIKGLFN